MQHTLLSAVSVLLVTLALTLFLIYAAVRIFESPREWVDIESGNEIELVAAVAQIAIAAVLATITWVSVRESRRMSKANEDMTALQLYSQRAADLPIIEFGVEDRPNVNSFVLSLLNSGRGPAIDVVLSITESAMDYELSVVPTDLPFFLGAGTDRSFCIRVKDTRSPFVEGPTFFDPDPREDRNVKLLGWPKIAAALRERGDPLPDEYDRWAEQRDEFNFEVRHRLGQLKSAGAVRAIYKDLHGQTISTHAELVIDHAVHSLEWPRVEVGTTRITVPQVSVTGLSC